VKLVATSGAVEHELGVIDTREVEGACGLHLAHGETERPRVSGKIIDDVLGEIGAVHLGNNVVVVDVGGVLKESCTVNVERRCTKVVFVRPVTTRRLTRNKMKRFDGVVKVAQINVGISVGSELMLSLGDEEFVLGIGEILALISVKVDVVTKDLGCSVRGKTITALYTDLDVMILKRNEGESLGPIFTKEKGNHVMITSVVLLTGVGGHSERSFSSRVTHEWVVNTLNVEGIELGYLLTTDPKGKCSWVGGVVREKTIRVLLNLRNTISLDPDVAHKITLGTNGDSDLVGITESADVIHALGLHGEVGIALVVLTEKADLRGASDVHILSTD